MVGCWRPECRVKVAESATQLVFFCRKKSAQYAFEVIIS
jgi:hypothetical protein